MASSILPVPIDNRSLNRTQQSCVQRGSTMPRREDNFNQRINRAHTRLAVLERLTWLEWSAIGTGERQTPGRILFHDSSCEGAWAPS